MDENTRRRGRPLSKFNAAVNNANPKLLAMLAHEAERINADVITPPELAAETIRQTRREIFQHYQPGGAAVANETKAAARELRLVLVETALNDQSRNVRRLSNIRAAEILAGELGLSLHTLRKDIAQIRKLTGPT